MAKKLRQAECVVNCNVAIGKGNVLASDLTLLKENGGSLNLDFDQKASNNSKAACAPRFYESC